MPYKKRAVCRIIALLMAPLPQQSCLLKTVAVSTFRQASCIFLPRFARLEFNLSTLSKKGWWQATNSFPIPGCLFPTSSFHRIVNRASHDKDDCSKHLGSCCFNTKSILRWLTQVMPYNAWDLTYFLRKKWLTKVRGVEQDMKSYINMPLFLKVQLHLLMLWVFLKYDAFAQHFIYSKYNYTCRLICWVKISRARLVSILPILLVLAHLIYSQWYLRGIRLFHFISLKGNCLKGGK